MAVHNIRSPEQWDIISSHIDFKGKSAIDLGCGKGDILFCAHDAGADAMGIDSDPKNARYAVDVWHRGIKILQGDIDLLDEWPWPLEKSDIIICFSVLPYLQRPEHALKWINQHSDIALIECQYAGDGPGFSFLTGNDDMKEWLLKYGEFEKVDIIGHTLVEGRNKKRFIWRCE